MVAGFGFASRLGRSGGSSSVSRNVSTQSSSATSTNTQSARAFPTVLLSSMANALSSVRSTGASSTSLRNGPARSRNARIRRRRGLRGASALPSFGARNRRGRIRRNTVRLTPAGAASRREPNFSGRIGGASSGTPITNSLIASSSPLVLNASRRLQEALREPTSSYLNFLNPGDRRPTDTLRRNNNSNIDRRQIALERGDPPTAPEEDEEQTGPASLAMREAEKPRIFGIVEQGVRPNGTPEKLVIIVKRPETSRFTIDEYFLEKKSVFEDEDYQRITVPKTQRVARRYRRVIRRRGLQDPRRYFTYTDRDLLPGRVYSYRIVVNYQEQRRPESAATTSTLSWADRVMTRAARESQAVGGLANRLGLNSFRDSVSSAAQAIGRVSVRSTSSNRNIRSSPGRARVRVGRL